MYHQDFVARAQQQCRSISCSKFEIEVNQAEQRINVKIYMAGKCDTYTAKP